MPGPGRSDLFRKLLARILSGELQEDDETAQHRPGMRQAVDAIKSLGSLHQPRGAFAAPTAELLEPIERPDLAAGDAQQAKDTAAAAKKMKELAAAREQDEWVRSVGYEPLPISDPEKGILVGGESPQVGEPTSFKERLIRAQASAAGRAGKFGAEPDSLDFQKSLRNAGGGFSDPEMTPELAARLRDRDEWLAGQPFRDAKFRLSTRDVDPVAAAPALAQVAAEERAAQKQRSEDVLIDALSGMESGKIPWDKAAAYEARGINIPQDRIGISGEEALNEANVLMAQAQDDMGRASSLDATMDKSIGFGGEFARLVAPIIARYVQESQGGDPQAAKDRFYRRFAEIRAAFLEDVRKRPQGLEENFGIAGVKIERPGGGTGPLKGGERFTSGS